MASVRSTTGLPPGVHVGPTGPRLLAALVEVGPVWLLIGLAGLFGLILDGRTAIAVVFVLLALAWGVLVWAQRASKAAGVGMRLDGLQLVGFSDGRPIGWGRVLIRWLVFAGLTITVVGLIVMLVAMSRHPRRQGWHDLAANAVVIKERPLAPPRTKPAVAQTRTPVAATSSAPRPVAVEGPVAGQGEASSGAGAIQSPASSDPGSASPDQASAEPLEADSAEAVVSAGDSEDSPSETDQPEDSPDEEGRSGEPAATDAPDLTAYAWVLRLDDGRDVGVERLVLLGRNPQPRVGEEDATLIKVPDEGRTVSKSHLAVGVDARGLYVMDRGSTNGTTVTTPDGGQRPCPPGDLIDVPAGSVVSFGDHWLEVRKPGDQLVTAGVAESDR